MANETFHAGERELQQRFDATRLADSVAAKAVHAAFSEKDIAFIRRMDMFFLATSDAEGNLDCSYKGGEPGFVRITGDSTLVFPWYDGNGMFMSSGNILQNRNVGMLFIDFEDQWRMRVNGKAELLYDDPMLDEYPGAQFLVRVTAEYIFPNCPRYIHKMQLVERSVFVPKAECEVPEPEWKDHFEEVLPRDQQERRKSRS